jgi:hypothetical protein
MRLCVDGVLVGAGDIGAGKLRGGENGGVPRYHSGGEGDTFAAEARLRWASLGFA